jgi:hypothetical protein
VVVLGNGGYDAGIHWVLQFSVKRQKKIIEQWMIIASPVQFTFKLFAPKPLKILDNIYILYR